MSTDAPRYTIWAATNHGDVPRSTDNPAMVRVLVAEARRDRHTGAVTVTDRGTQVAHGSWDNDTMDDLDNWLTALTA